MAAKCVRTGQQDTKCRRCGLEEVKRTWLVSLSLQKQFTKHALLFSIFAVCMMYDRVVTWVVLAKAFVFLFRNLRMCVDTGISVWRLSSKHSETEMLTRRARSRVEPVRQKRAGPSGHRRETEKTCEQIANMICTRKFRSTPAEVDEVVQMRIPQVLVFSSVHPVSKIPASTV